MSNPLDRLKDLHKKVFVKGQEAVAQEEDTVRFEDEQSFEQRVLKAASDTIDLADQLAADGSPHKQRLAAAIKNRVVGAVEDRGTERHRAEEVSEPIEASPFVVNLKHSEPRLPGSPPSASLPAPSEAPKKKRGRPPKGPKG